MSSPTGNPGDPLSVKETDRGTTANPVVVKQASDIPKGTVADPVVTSATFDKKMILWQAIIAAIVTISLAYLQRNTDAKVERTNEKVDRVEKTGASTHALVNSKFGAVLRALAANLRNTANRTGDPADIKAANEAEQDYKDHQAGQKRADEGKDTGR